MMAWVWLFLQSWSLLLLAETVMAEMSMLGL